MKIGLNSVAGLIISMLISLTYCSMPTSKEVNSGTLDTAAVTNETFISSEIVESEGKAAGNSERVYLESDRVALTQLIRRVYTWRASSHLDDFPYLYETSNPGILVGIDWEKYRQNVSQLIDTDLFTDAFIRKHKSIALSLDSSIRKADLKWRDVNGYIPIWSTDRDDWCDCQDYPDRYWELLTINDLKIENDLATLNWTWDTDATNYPHTYQITARKINNSWKINSLYGFKYYQSVRYYDDIMNGQNDSD